MNRRRFSQSEVDELARPLHRRQILGALRTGGGHVEQVGPDEYRTTDAGGRQAIVRFHPDGGVRSLFPGGRSSTVWFDGQGRITRAIDPSGLETRTSDAPNGGRRVERVSHGSFVAAHDSYGCPTRVELPDGSTSSIDWDTPGGETITDRAGRKSRRLRDKDGRRMGWVDPRGGVTKVEERLTALGHAVVQTSPRGRVDTFMTDGRGRLSEWSVDGQVVATSQGESLPGIPQSIHYADGHFVTLTAVNGKLLAAEGPNGRVALSYDDAGRLVAENQNGLLVRYERDASGLLIGIVLPDGSAIRYAYDESGRLAAVRDWDGQQTRIRWSESGQITSVSHPNGVATAIDSDVLARVTSMVTIAPGSTKPLASGRYAYDVCDRLVGAEEDGLAFTYVYDPLDRLDRVQCSDPTLSDDFGLDEMGNLTRRAGLAYAADPDNRLTGAGPHAISYDILGRTREITTANGRLRLTYNGQGQLIRAEAQGRVTDYAYDALGRRIWKRRDGVTTRFLWAGQTLLSEWTDGPGAGFQRRDHVFLPDMFLPIAMRVDGATYAVHCDRRGGATAMTDARGAPVWRARLDVFGLARTSVAQVECPWRLANQYADAETGLHYNLIRYMHPGLGRFLTPDSAFDPKTRGNWYLYAAGDPLNQTDPTGELVIPAIFVAIAVGAVIGAAVAGAFKAYELRNEDMSAGDRATAIGKAALVGGVVGAVGGLVGFVAGTAVAGLMGAAAAGAIVGGITAVAETCAEAAITGKPLTEEDLAIAILVGAGIGAVTAGVGGAIAARAARRKLAKEAAEALAAAEKKAARDAAEKKLAQEAADALAAAERKAAKEAQEKLNQTLLEELKKNGVKHDPNKVVKIGRNKEGKVVFIETGNAKAGLEHITGRHADDFAKAGIPENEIADAVLEAVTKGKKVGVQGKGREIYEFVHNGETKRIAVSIGDNGFIVGANPVSSTWTPQ